MGKMLFAPLLQLMLFFCCAMAQEEARSQQPREDTNSPTEAKGTVVLSEDDSNVEDSRRPASEGSDLLFRLKFQKHFEAPIADLSQRVYHELTKTETGNFVFSPLSLHSALTLLLLGSEDKTETEKEVLLMLGSITNREYLKEAYRQLVSSYQQQTTFSYNNRVWVDKKFNLNPEYVKEAYDYLGTNTTALRFEDVSATLEAINQWVKEATGGQIPTALEDIDRNVQLLLANAIYLKEEWKVAFSDVDAQDVPLTNQTFKLGGSQGDARVDMMETPHELNFTYAKIRLPHDDLLADIVTLPYKNTDFAMQIILPNKAHGGDGLALLEDEIGDIIARDRTAEVKTKNVTEETFNIFAQYQEQRWRESFLRMPKFRVASRFDAADIFQRMNLTRVFSDQAELGRLSTDASNLNVDSIKHAAIVEVDKEGTEAAAATVVQITFLSAVSTEPWVVDRPFMFVVRDMRHNIPVLVGRVTNPANLV